MECSCSTCHKCPFSPLRSSFLGFSSAYSSRLRFCFSSSRYSLLLVVNSILSCRGPLPPGTISTLSDLMGRCQAGFFGRAQEKGSRQNRDGIDGTQVHKSREDGTKRRYKNAASLWLEYVLWPCLLLRGFTLPSPISSSSPDLVTIDLSPLS